MEVVEQYADAYRDGDTFPPVDLFTEDGESYWPGDGIHRCKAAIEAGKSSISAIVHQGDLHAAQVFACSANKKHGLYRTNVDKRHAVQTMLALEPKWSNRRIAEHVGVGNQIVSQVRQAMVSKKEIADSPTREGRDGRTYDAPSSASLQNTSKKSRLHDSHTPPTGETASDSFDPVEIEEADSSLSIDELADWYVAAVRNLNEIIRQANRAAEEEKTGAYLADTVVRIVKHLEDAKAGLRMATPVALCDRCDGGCKHCANTGFITRMMQESKQ